jgi:hypothetical protein
MNAKKKEEQAKEMSVLSGVTMRLAEPRVVNILMGEKSTGIAAVDVEIRKIDDAILGHVPKKKLKLDKATLAEWIKKVTITIDDKNDNDPITVVFEGEWTGRDLNLAEKNLILEYSVYVRNRMIN